jgi:hypothetical protein
MNPTLLIVVVAVALTLVLAAAALRRDRQIAGIADLEARWQKIDIEAFLNLVDPAEERYLRRNLSTIEFNRIHRLRIRVMWEYLGRLSFNSRLMMQAGQMVQHHSSGERLIEATKLVATASRMRLMIFVADVYLAVRFLLPETQDPIRRLVANYDALTQMFTQTCGRQFASVRSVAG